MKNQLKFVIAGLGGGQSNTGYNTAFLIYVLGVKRDWQEKVIGEIKRVAGRFTPNDSLSLSDRLAYVPISAWEGEFPILLSCLNESIRHTLMGSAIRKNISSKPLRLENDVVVPAKGFTVCQYADVRGSLCRVHDRYFTIVQMLMSRIGSLRS